MKLIAFYLPQYHEIPENNLWWGQGFTEWTNVKKAKPLFKNHNQPRIPLNGNYYNILKNDVQKWQIELAKKYGLYGFCFYHYWFKDGKKLLEKPVEKYLHDKNLDFPFCLSWANEPWSRRWDGKEHDILMPQEYGNKNEWKMHFEYLLPFFKDERYIKINGEPLFVIYKPELIPNLNEMLDYWQHLANENKIGKIRFAYQFPDYYFIENKEDRKFDYAIEFEPKFSDKLMSKRSFCEKIYRNFVLLFSDFSIFKEKVKKLINNILKKLSLNFRIKTLNKISYSEVARVSTCHKPLNNKSIPGVFTDWDNTPRKGKNGTIYHGSSPERFQKYLSKQIKRAKSVYNTEFIFINAWNEWGEGAYLEPDEKHGYAYLEAVRNALVENGYYTNHFPIKDHKN